MGDAKSGFAAEAYEIIEFQRVKPRCDVVARFGSAGRHIRDD
jgi:hypothetical protein